MPWPRTTCGADWPAWWPTRRDRRTVRTARRCGSRLRRGRNRGPHEGARIVGEAGALEGGDDKARIGALQRMLGLGNDAAGAAPAVDGAILEVAEHARRLARGDA